MDQNVGETAYPKHFIRQINTSINNTCCEAKYFWRLGRSGYIFNSVSL